MKAMARLWLFACALMAVFWSGALFAQPGLVPGPAPAPPLPAEAKAPGDAPHLPARVTRPPVPESFNSFDGHWISFAYPPEVRERVQPLIADADGFRRTLSSLLGRPVLLAQGNAARVHVRIARTSGEMASLAPEGYPPPKYASGVAYSSIGLVLLTIEPLHPNSRHDLPEVFRHELAHVGIYDAVAGHHIPRWFNEGFAVYASGESSLARLQTLWTATITDGLIPLERLEYRFPKDDVEVSVAYAEAADVVRFLIRREDRSRFESLINRVRKGQGFPLAVRDAYGVDLIRIEYEWRADVAKRYTFWPVLFSGSFVWMGAFALFGLAWRRKRARAKKILDRWEVEEAEEDRRRAELREAVRVHLAVPGDGRAALVSIAGSARSFSDDPEEEGLPAAAEHILDRLRPQEALAPAVGAEREVPRVRIDGSWHTLH